MGGSTVRSRGGHDRDHSLGGGLPGTHPSGRREHATGGASESGDRRKPRADPKTGGSARACFLKIHRGRRGLVRHAHSTGHAPRVLCWPPPGCRARLPLRFRALAKRQKTGIPPLPAASRAPASLPSPSHPQSFLPSASGAS